MVADFELRARVLPQLALSLVSHEEAVHAVRAGQADKALRLLAIVERHVRFTRRLFREHLAEQQA